MLLIHCPYCEEERPELEFRHAGEAHIARPADIAAESDADFEAYFFIRKNPRGLAYERWRHIHGCARFFNAVRDTVSDRILTTYKAGEKKPDPARFRAPDTAQSIDEQAAPEPSAKPRRTAERERKKDTAR
ncbi:sarcosine oxidase subunit delta [Nitratireductor mangrovi]|uniref:Sarcosine oxidase subunit delta n=1 Tax=Nitratireductor mangrovi TaxID=2599600 RepID=A0A5B8L4Z8_9HYPH|nr:sarcosine oxidase subunit delta [Nitratireductor mangrovi]QDZ03116.1 sarcosine oxidase subunit delta [Nitratireductor mangrovi]